MIEQPFRFEDEDAGVLTLPPVGVARRRWGVIWLNAGAIRRTGPFRLHVHAARRFADLGFPTLRIDQPGVGDHLPTARRSQIDLVATLLDRLQAATACERFVIGGICSAADMAWQSALCDERIAGLILLDPVARRRAPGFRLGQLQMLLRRGPAGWVEWLAKRLHRPVRRPAIADDQLREWPAEGRESSDLAQLVDRGVECFCLYTGGAATYFTHPRQFRAGFGPAALSPSVHFEYWRDCDHLFFRPDDRDRLIDVLGRWLTDRVATDMRNPTEGN